MSTEVDVGRALYEREVVRRILELREDLVRHDENWRAYQLLTESVPYFAVDHPAIVEARKAQREMVAHLLDPEEYRRYYAENPHERPFEEQYGLEVSEAHRIPRIGLLREALAKMHTARPDVMPLRVVDLGANDGFMAANIGALGYVVTDCVDLHPGNCEIARRRRDGGAAIGQVIQADAAEVDRLHREGTLSGFPDAVVAFELVEHVPDPRALLAAMAAVCSRDGRLFISTPDGAVEAGNVPGWDHVERKGHVRSLRESDLRALCEEVGEVEQLVRGPDGVLVAQVRPTG